MNRSEAEEMLKRVPYDGAFLVRPSETDDDAFAISFRLGARSCESEQYEIIYLLFRSKCIFYSTLGQRKKSSTVELSTKDVCL